MRRKIAIAVVILVYVTMLLICNYVNEQTDTSTTVEITEDYIIYVEDYLDTPFAQTVKHGGCLVAGLLGGMISLTIASIYSDIKSKD